MTEREAQALGEWLDRGPTMLWTALPNGELDWVSAAVLDQFGRASDELMRWGWVELVHADDIDPVGERWSACLESGEPYEMEFRLRLADGRFHWHLARALPYRGLSGRIEKWVGGLIDIEGLRGWSRT